MKILQIGNPLLERTARKVENVKDIKVQKLIAELEFFVSEDKLSAGLAAPQIGEDIAVCTVKKFDDSEDESKSEVFTLINPKVVKRSANTTIFWEGCLSVGEGDNRLFGPVERPEWIIFEYTDKKGIKRTEKATGYFSHVVQHEVDHLEGVLFVNYVKNPLNLWKSKDLDDYLEENDHFPPVVGSKISVPEMVV